MCIRDSPETAREVGRSAGSGERRRCHRAGGLHVARDEPDSRNRDGVQRGRRVCGRARQHHGLAERACLRPGGLPPGRSGRRMVGRHRVRRAVFLPAGGHPSGARGGNHPQRGEHARRQAAGSAGPDEERRRASTQDLRDDRRVYGVRRGALRGLLRSGERSDPRTRYIRRGRNDHP